jgi:hypothetical protein
MVASMNVSMFLKPHSGGILVELLHPFHKKPCSGGFLVAAMKLVCFCSRIAATRLLKNKMHITYLMIKPTPRSGNIS